MARMICSCGYLLSTTCVPNDIQLRVFTDGEWKSILDDGIKESWLIPLPTYDVWKCPDCKSVYVFEWGYGKPVMTYRLEKQCDHKEWIVSRGTVRENDVMAHRICSCGHVLSTHNEPNNIQLRVYTDEEWENILDCEFIDPLMIPLPKYEVLRCLECKNIYVFERDQDKPVMSYRLEK